MFTREIHENTQSIRIEHTIDLAYGMAKRIYRLAKGIGAGAVSLATLGYFKNINTSAFDSLFSAKDLCSKAYSSGLKILNPNADIDLSEEALSPVKWVNNNLLFRVSSNDPFFKREVLFRLSQPLSLAASIIAHVAETALAPFIVTASLLTLGRYKTLNNYAYTYLQAAPGALLETYIHIYNMIELRSIFSSEEL